MVPDTDDESELDEFESEPELELSPEIDPDPEFNSDVESLCIWSIQMFLGFSYSSVIGESVETHQADELLTDIYAKWCDFS